MLVRIALAQSAAVFVSPTGIRKRESMAAFAAAASSRGGTLTRNCFRSAGSGSDPSISSMHSGRCCSVCASISSALLLSAAALSGVTRSYPSRKKVRSPRAVALS